MRRLMASLAAAVVAPAAAAQPPSAEELLREVGFGKDAEQRVLSGEFVSTSIPSSSPRDLALALAFLVEETPKAFDQELFRELLLTRVDPGTRAQGLLSADPTPAELSDLELGPEERRLYAAAKPGDSVHLGTRELATLAALGGAGADVTAAVRELLLARLHAYRSQGLAGIAPYQLGDGQTDGASDLRKASEAASAVKSNEPDLYRLLLEYPKGAPPKLREIFFWSHFEAHGEMTIALTHALSVRDDDAFTVVQRQFYVSRGYNVEQAIASFIPVKHGTLVVYTNHTSTNQIAGFGGRAKRDIGEKLMAAQLEELFGKLRAMAAD